MLNPDLIVEATIWHFDDVTIMIIGIHIGTALITCLFPLAWGGWM